jgi:hypothetical protein
MQRMKSAMKSMMEKVEVANYENAMKIVKT